MKTDLVARAQCRRIRGLQSPRYMPPARPLEFGPEHDITVFIRGRELVSALANRVHML